MRGVSRKSLVLIICYKACVTLRYTLISVVPYTIPILFLLSFSHFSLFFFPPSQGIKTEVKPVAGMNSIALCNDEFRRLGNSRLFILKGET